MHEITPVVQKIIFINVMLFLAGNILPAYIPQFAILPFDMGFQPYQIVTNIFYHLGIGHLLMNMIALFFLGTYVEKALGMKRFVILYIASGILAGLAQIILAERGGLGASGAINGIMVAFAFLFPNVKLQLLFIPIPIRAMYFAIGFIFYDVIMAALRINTGIGHYAHLGGALMGLVLILMWKPKISRWN